MSRYEISYSTMLNISQTKIKPQVKLKLIKDITNYKTSLNLQNLETEYITPFRFTKSKNNI